MKLMKKLMAAILCLSMMAPMVTSVASAANTVNPSPKSTDITGSKFAVSITATRTARVYNGQYQHPIYAVTVKYNKGGKVYTLKNGVDYKVQFNRYYQGLNAGSYTGRVYVTGLGKFTGTKIKDIKWTIAKANQKIVATPKGKAYTVAGCKAAARSFYITMSSVKGGNCTFTSKSTKVTVKVVSKNKALVTVKKGTGKGTYQVSINSAANTNYNKSNYMFNIVVK